jgi:hypothetical protein
MKGTVALSARAWFAIGLVTSVLAAFDFAPIPCFDMGSYHNPT